MGADDLASNRRQAITNHRTGVIMVILCVKGIILHPLNNVRERPSGRLPVSFFVIDGFALWQRQCAMWCPQPVNENSVKYNIEGLYERLFTIINTFVEMAIQYPYCEIMILHEHLYNKKDLHLNLPYTNCTELVFWDGMRQVIIRTNQVFFQRAFYKLSVKLGKYLFLSKYIFILFTTVYRWIVQCVDSSNLRHFLHKAGSIR